METGVVFGMGWGVLGGVDCVVASSVTGVHPNIAASSTTSTSDLPPSATPPTSSSSQTFLHPNNLHLQMIDAIIFPFDLFLQLNNLTIQPLDLETHPTVDLPL